MHHRLPVHSMVSSSLKVSVVTCSYNMSAFVEEAIGSALAQSYPVHECIVVDDGSTDDTLQRLAQIADPRLRVFEASHGGISPARNFALSHVTGDIVCFLDADDRWVPNKVEHEIAVFESEPDVGAVFVNVRRFDADGFFPRDQFSFYPELAELLTRPTRAGGGRVIQGDAFSILVGFEEFPSWTPSNSFRRSVVAGLQFEPDLPMCEDLHYCFSAYRNTRVAFIAEPLVHLRRHGHNMTTNFRMLPHATHKALMRLGEASLSTRQRQALHARIARSLVAFGRESAMRGDVAAALANYSAAVRYGPKWPSLVKQIAMTPYYLVRRSISASAQR
jgi:glycosyltransferase involved in cell wall biosynthesis